MRNLINRLYSRYYKIGLLGENKLGKDVFIKTLCKDRELLEQIAKDVQGRSKKYRVEIWQSRFEYAPEIKYYGFMFIKN